MVMICNGIDCNKPGDAYSLGKTDKIRSDVQRRTVRILLAEDDLEMRRYLALSLRKDGYDVTEAVDGVQLLERIAPYLHDGNQFAFDLIISDIRMPGIDGMEILAGLHTCSNAPPVILITAFGDDRTHIEAKELGVVRVLDKPFDIGDLRTTVKGVLSRGPDHAGGPPS